MDDFAVELVVPLRILIDWNGNVFAGTDSPHNGCHFSPTVALINVRLQQIVSATKIFDYVAVMPQLMEENGCVFRCTGACSSMTDKTERRMIDDGLRGPPIPDAPQPLVLVANRQNCFCSGARAVNFFQHITLVTAVNQLQLGCCVSWKELRHSTRIGRVYR
jgi:hypothetical protein